jgi:hypothetical protein
LKSAMEMTKSSDNSQTTFSMLTMAILSLFILSLGPSSEHLQLPNTCFSIELAL